MATFSDLEPLPYFNEVFSDLLVAVGWLGRGRPFEKGPIPEAVYRRLKELRVHPFQPFVSAGSHGCELCLFEPELHGSANLFVPSGGQIFVCPELIVHYINAHGYRPPDVFCDAVLACPDMRSMDYKRKLLAAGGGRLFGAS